MNLTKKDSEDFTTFASVVNKHCGNIKQSELRANNLKCLIFVQELIFSKSRVLNKLENEPNFTLRQIAEDYERFVSVRQDSKNIQESGIAHIRKVRQKKNQSNSPSKLNQYKKKQDNQALTRDPVVGHYIGIMIAFTGIKSPLLVAVSSTRAHTAE